METQLSARKGEQYSALQKFAWFAMNWLFWFPRAMVFLLEPRQNLRYGEVTTITVSMVTIFAFLLPVVGYFSGIATERESLTIGGGMYLFVGLIDFRCAVWHKAI